MMKQSNSRYPTKKPAPDEVILCISKTRLRQLLQAGHLFASDFKCANNCTKCVVRELLLECASIDLAANDN